MKTYYDEHADLAHIVQETIAVIGYGIRASSSNSAYRAYSVSRRARKRGHLPPSKKVLNEHEKLKAEIRREKDEAHDFTP